jgi:hypothetical protein
MDDGEVWKRRLIAYTFVRLLGLAVFFLGIAIAYGSLLRPGGWPQLGAIVVIAGALSALLIPRLLKKRWDPSQEDRAS